jgi:hypothetical protein
LGEKAGTHTRDHHAARGKPSAFVEKLSSIHFGPPCPAREEGIGIDFTPPAPPPNGFHLENGYILSEVRILNENSRG